MGDTTIEWTDATWNPVRGCSRVSPGCENCYAERIAARFSKPGLPFEGFAKMTSAGGRWTRKVELVPEKLGEPLSWRKPRRIFVNSMSDLFHEDLPFGDIAKIFHVMTGEASAKAAPEHTYQVLTKRPEVAVRFFEWLRTTPIERLPLEAIPLADMVKYGGGRLWPRVWMGVSVENQEQAMKRIPQLLRLPFRVRFLSCEPLLGPIHLPSYFHDGAEGDYTLGSTGISWVIVGGESGPGARPMHPDWARNLRDDCIGAGIAFHFKQWGEWFEPKAREEPAGVPRVVLDVSSLEGDDSAQLYRIGKKAAGRELDGRTWDQFPEVR